MALELSKIVRNVRSGADQIATASAEIASGNSDLSQRTEQQAANLQETTASMDEITATVQNATQSANQAAQLSQSASTVAKAGGESVQAVVNTMDEITKSSKKISDIISVIDGIAFQTNILALNAAVEAARAGEHGRGFSVVASEVRALAQRSATAAKEIKHLIDESVSRIEQGNHQVSAAGKTIVDVVTHISKVNDLVSEIASAANEQHKGIVQINQAIAQMDQGTQQNAALVEESAAASESMRTQSTRMVEMVSHFQLGDLVVGSAPETVSIKPMASSTSMTKPLNVTVKPNALKTSSTSKNVHKDENTLTKPVLVKERIGADEDWETF